MPYLTLQHMLPRLVTWKTKTVVASRFCVDNIPNLNVLGRDTVTLMNVSFGSIFLPCSAKFDRNAEPKARNKELHPDRRLQ